MASKSICLVISHYIFLDRGERYALYNSDGTLITTTGWYVPVWSSGLPKKNRRNSTTDEPASEIICRYRVTNKKRSAVIEPEEVGFYLSLISKNVRGKLLDPKDLGAASVNFVYKGKWEIEETIYPVLNFVNISDSEVLLKTLV